MRTIETTLHKFTELSEEAKETAINNKATEQDGYHIWDEAENSVIEFVKLFGLKPGTRSWLDFNTHIIDDQITELKGLRLRTYLINNFWDGIYQGKYYSLWSKKEKSYKHHVNGFPVLKDRRSKVFFNCDCPLTGVCYDYSILDPIINIIEKYNPADHDQITFEEIINDCSYSLKKAIDEEIEFIQSDEYITDFLEGENEEIFTEEGNTF